MKLALGLFLALAAGADSAVDVALVTHGSPVALTETDRIRIADAVRVLMMGCGMTSLAFPDLFAGRSLSTEWRDALAGSHLYVRFPTPLVARSGVSISEVVIPLAHPGIIGPEMSRDGEEVVGHVKCDGYRALALMCATALRPHLLPIQADRCEAYDAIEASRGRQSAPAGPSPRPPTGAGRW